MSRANLLTACLTLPLWAACAIGSPLVDDQSDGFGIGSLECRMPPRCEPRKFDDPKLPPSDPLDLERCAGQALCSPVRVSSDDPAPSDRDSSCASQPVDSLPLVATCTRQVLRVPQGVSELRYDNAHWSNFKLTIESTAPVRVALGAPELQAVDVHLKGPVTFHVERAKPMDLRVHGESSADGEPHVSLLDVEGKQLRVGDLSHMFQGLVTMRECELTEVELQATEIDLKSSRLSQGLIHSRAVSGADMTLKSLDLQSDHTLLSDFETQTCRFQLCEYATLIGGHVDNTLIDVCDDTALHLYGSIVTSSALDGLILSDDSNLENTALGVSHGSQFISYQSRITSTALCGSLQRLTLDATSQIKCSSCEPSFDAQTQACQFPVPANAPSPVLANFCMELKKGRALPECGSETPPRTRMR